MTVHLAADLLEFMDSRVASGTYSSHDAILRAAFSLLEQREALLARIDQGTEELRRGDGVPLQSEADWDDFFEEIKDRGIARNQARGGQ
jgi:putative addiction module CopG family antidote